MLLRGPAELSCPIPGPPAAPAPPRNERALRAQRWNSPERRPLSPAKGGSPVTFPGPACGHVRSQSRAAAIPRPKGRCGLQQGQGDTPGLQQRRRERTAAPAAFTCAGGTRSCGALGSSAVCACLCTAERTCRHRDTCQNTDTHVRAQINVHAHTCIHRCTRACLVCGTCPRCCCPAASASPSCCH